MPDSCSLAHVRPFLAALLALSCSGAVEHDEPAPACGEWTYRVTVHAPAGKYVRFMAAPGHEGHVRFRPEGYDVCKGVPCVRLRDGATADVMVDAEGVTWEAVEAESEAETPGCP